MTNASTTSVDLRIMDDELAVCRLPSTATAPVPNESPFFALVRTKDELSIVCNIRHALPGATVEAGWVALEVAGPLDFAMTGVLASIAGPLAEAGISIFVVSTFDTDYILVKQQTVGAAVTHLREAGHRFLPTHSDIDSH